MLTIATNGPDNPNKAILPFAALKGSVGAAADGTYPDERPEMFLMQEAIYLASENTDLHEINAVGLPPAGEILDVLSQHNVRMIVCKPCAEGRGIKRQDQIIEVAEIGSGKDLAALTQQHEEVLTF